jgi:hypothetical protein
VHTIPGSCRDLVIPAFQVDCVELVSHNAAAVIFADCCSASCVVVMTMGEKEVLEGNARGNDLSNAPFQRAVRHAGPGVNQGSLVSKAHEINSGVGFMGQSTAPYLPQMVINNGFQ